VLGAYSQYGWFHPGPLLFYLLAPFYTVGGRTVYGLDLGAFVINVLSLVIIASIVGRRRSLSPVTAVSLLAGLSAYLARLPDLLTSAWNPHISVWPFAALIACTAALPYAGSTSALVFAAGTVIVAALPVAAILRWRGGYRFESVLAVVCFVATAVGLWSVLHIHGQIGDYQLFWLSVLGVFDLALGTGGVAAFVSHRLTASWLNPRFVGVAASSFGIAAVLMARVTSCSQPGREIWRTRTNAFVVS